MRGRGRTGTRRSRKGHGRTRRAGRALWRFVLLLAVLVGGVAVGSFLHFTHSVRTSVPPPLVEPLPGAVVLTGGQGRVDAGVRLLAEGRARRLLISGVNPRTTEAAIRRAVAPAVVRNGGDGERQRLEGLFTCCVQLGRSALDTVGNARETRDWATARGLDRLLVVTSDYHMPRALLELRRALPGTALTPWPVTSPRLREAGWYADPAALRRLAGEWARLVSARARDWLGEDVIERLRGVGRRERDVARNGAVRAVPPVARTR